MSKKQNDLIWGVILVLFGGVLLVDSLGFVPEFSQAGWAVVMGLACLFFAAVYFSVGKRHWAWFLPIFATGGVAMTAVLSMTDMNPLWIGALLMAFISIPFWLIFLLDRRENWWALIPGYALAVLTLIILVSETWAGEVIGAVVMWSIALPFLYVFLRNSAHWWALIPGFVMAAMGIVVLSSATASGEIIGSIVMLAVALPFFVLYFFTRGQWWAIIPAVVLTTLAFIIPFTFGMESETLEARLVIVGMFLGFAIPFSWLWLRRDRYPTSWAKYPAAGFMTAALVTLALGTIIQSGWPIILIVLGAWLLYDNLRQPKLKP